MKRVSIFAVSFIFAAIFAVSASAQTAAPTGKVGLVDTGMFGDDKAGIRKLVTAYGSLETEFKPINDKLNGILTRGRTLETEIKNLQQTSGNAAVPVNTSSLQTKADELERLQTQLKREQEDAKANFSRREQAVVGPIFADIQKAMNDYAKQKGYAVIFDGAKLMQAGVLWGYDDKIDVTKDFITFYNARPAGAATASVPK